MEFRARRSRIEHWKNSCVYSAKTWISQQVDESAKEFFYLRIFTEKTKLFACFFHQYSRIVSDLMHGFFENLSSCSFQKICGARLYKTHIVWREFSLFFCHEWRQFQEHE